MNDMLEMILDTTTRIFTNHCTPEVLEAAGQGQWPDSLWKAISDAGLTRALLAEEEGGAGLSWAEGLAVIRLAGYHRIPAPLPETMLAARLLADAGVPLPEGPVSLAPWQPGPSLQVERLADGWRLSGVCKRVPWGRQVRAVLAAIETDAGSRLVCFDPSLGEVSEGMNLAFEPRDTLRLDGITVPASAVFELNHGSDLFHLGALMRAQQLAGAMQKALDQSVQYAGERVQFGRSISKFQAIQQQLADLAGQVAIANAAAQAAADHWGTDKSDFFVAVAKARAGEGANRAAAIAHQVHGAMGFTREHSLHYATRRLWSWRDEFGNESDWQQRLGQQVLKLGAEQLWPYLVDPATTLQEVKG